MKRMIEQLKKYKYKDLIILIIALIVITFLLYYITTNFKAVIFAVSFVAKGILSSLKPLLIAVALAYLIDPLVMKINRRVFKQSEMEIHIGAILTVYAIIAIVLASVLMCFLVLLMGQIPQGDLSQIISAIVQRLIEYKDEVVTSLNSFPKFFSNSLTSYASETFKNPIDIIKNATNIIINLGIAVIMSIYIEKDRKFFIKAIRKCCHLTLSHWRHALLAEAWDEINRIFSKYLRGTMVDSMIIAILVCAFLFIMKIKLAAFWGLLTGFLNIIPYFGPIISAAPILIVAYTTWGFGKAVAVLIGLVLIQQLDSNLIYPKIVGDSTGLHPLTILASVSALGYAGGIAGMILAVPIAAIVQRLILNWANNKQ